MTQGDSEPRLVSINIGGSDFTIRTDANQDYMERLEKYVNDKLAEVKTEGSTLPMRTTLSLAMLSIADDYFTATESRDELDQNVRSRIKKVLLRVDQALADE